MTHNKEVTFWCDSDGCDEWEQIAKQTITRALYEARQRGWSAPSWGEHYCFSCTNKEDYE